MKKTLLFLLFILPALITKGQDNDEQNILKAMHSISSQELFDYVKIMCDEKYAGRLTGTPEYQECAEWLAGKFSDWGLTPAGDNGSWFQWFNVPYTLVFPGCSLALDIPVKKDGIITKQYRYISEFVPGSTSASGEVSGEVVYAGYGISAPELNYDDYAGIDVRGKIVLIEREAPVSPSEGADKFNPWYKYSFHQYKLENAFRHGAAGMLYIYGPIANPNNDYIENFIYVHVGDSVVNDIFSGTGKNYRDNLEKINKSLRPSSFSTGKNVTVKMNTKHFPDGKGSNIIGLLKGSDPELSSETIIIGAHLDHLGKCYEMMPGANDNASAVAVMMGVAEALTKYKIPLKRSVLFISFGSEEQSLLGSKKYVLNPVLPLEKSILLNMDGVGTGDAIGAAAGENFPHLWSFVEEANKAYIHAFLRTNFFPNLGRPRLDAAIFMKAGVPSLSFSTTGAFSPYHLPGDNIETINPEIMEEMCRLLLLTTIRMANSPEQIIQAK
ncbi:MAG TPA: M28 family peptidase [Bacteroidales bacterium]|nr:M28 family peptidase [Bacteroidales bacterium]